MTHSFVYTAIGDSLTYGTGAQGNNGFAALVRNELTRGRPSVLWNSHGVVGATTSELLERIAVDDTVRASIALADVLTVTAGGNDLIQAAMKMYLQGAARSMKPPMKVFAAAYARFIDELIRINRTLERRSVIIVANCYNPFPQFKDAVLWINFVNRSIERTAALYGERLAVARVYEAFLGKEERLISDDTVHPNDAGHETIAACVKMAIDSKCGAHT